MSMCARIGLALALVVPAGSAMAQGPAARKLDPTGELLTKLRSTVDMERLGGISLAELATYLGEKFGITAMINEAAFRSNGDGANAGELMLKVPKTRSTSLSTLLRYILAQCDATYLVYKDHIEIVPIAYAARETKNIAATEDESPPRLAQPLVSMIFKEKPLNEAIAELAEEYSLTVIVSPQSGDARTGFVSARLLNTPADKALELLVVQCDLRIVRKANTFLVTSRDHANDLFNEELDRERNKIELDKLRTAPPPQPQPQLQFPILPITPVQIPNPNQNPAPNPNPPPPPKP